jgi:ubiquitin carboxyl-terminal hydrolase 4/11
MFYNLVGVVCHSGGMGMGHYTAYVRNVISRKWYHCNDSYITEVGAKVREH